MSALTTHKDFAEDLPPKIIELCIGFSIEMLYKNNNCLEGFYKVIKSI